MDSKIEVCSPEAQNTASSPSSGWFTYQSVILKAGATYEVSANTRNIGTTAQLALIDVDTNEVLSIISGNTATLTPTVDCYLAVNNCKYGTGTWTRTVIATSQTLTVGTIVNWTVNINTVTFDLFIYAVITGADLLNKLYGEHVAVVDYRGSADYKTIASAITGTNEGDTIIIMPGIYNEQLDMRGKVRHLVGVSRESVLIVSEYRYYNNEPLKANMGSIENLTLIAGYGLEPIEGETQAGNYALHIEYANNSPYEFIAKNCKFISNVSFAVGIGVRYNQTVKFIDCYFETKQRQAYSSSYANFFNCGGLFFHNDASGSNLGTDGLLEVTNCELKGVISAMAIQSQNNGNTLHARFVECLAWSTENGKTDALTIRTTPTEGHLAGSDVILEAMSFGNNISALNA